MVTCLMMPGSPKFSWVQFESYSTGMFCSTCRTAKLNVRSKSGVWVSTGCKSYRMDKIRKHEKSLAHKDACTLVLSRGVENAFREQVLANRAAILCSITCLYFLVKSEIPHTTNYVKLRRAPWKWFSSLSTSG